MFAWTWRLQKGSRWTRRCAPPNNQSASTKGGTSLSFVCPPCESSSVRGLSLVGVSGTWTAERRKQLVVLRLWCSACGGQYRWRKSNRVLISQDTDAWLAAKVFRALAFPQGACANLLNSVKSGGNSVRWLYGSK